MKINLVVFSLFLLLNNNAFSQSPTDEFYLLFYNVENLFDTWDDPETEDDEFTPQGVRHWTHKRFNKKLSNLSKVILNVSGWTPPQLIALCEVENRFVLEKLLQNTPLSIHPYRIIHKDSPDPRGIDAAFLYNHEVFYPLEYRYIPLHNKENGLLKSREILYVQGILNQMDTLHIFVNHWPSRYSGLLESQPARNLAAATLRKCVDEIQSKHLSPKIIITGDFNDQPNNESLRVHLQAKSTEVNLAGHTIYNLSFPWMQDEIKTLKHQSQWSVFDQFIVSGTLLDPEAKLYTKPDLAAIVKLPFLLEKDERYGNYKLNRTYIGFRYHGGFSDHLPILLKIRTNH